MEATDVKPEAIPSPALSQKPDEDKPPKRKAGEPPVSHTGLTLTRMTSFKYQLDPNNTQDQLFFQYAGANRYAFNYHVGDIKVNLSQREAERSYGIANDDLTPAENWSGFGRINKFTAYKNGKTHDTPVDEIGAKGLAWKDQVFAQVFENASTDAAQALTNWSDSRAGLRAGKPVGFPKFKAKHKTTPSFRLRNRTPEPNPSKHTVRTDGPKALHLPGIGHVRIHGTNKRMRKMIDAGRFWVSMVTIKYERGKWWVCITGYAAPFHPGRTSAKGRHETPAGVDLGIKTQAVVADVDGEELYLWKGVKALRNAQKQLRQANKALSRTKKGSNGRAKARARLTKIHAHITYLRTHLLHELTSILANKLSVLTVENLHVAGMLKNHCLALSISDAAFGKLREMLTYKADWYGLVLVLADRWFASSKTCSGCHHVEHDLTLADRIFNCGSCGLSIDRDLNAAINLASWGQEYLLDQAGELQHTEGPEEQTVKTLLQEHILHSVGASCT